MNSQKPQSPTKIKHRKTGIYLGAADSCEEYRDSDLNRLDSVMFRHYNSVTNQC